MASGSRITAPAVTASSQPKINIEHGKFSFTQLVKPELKKGSRRQKSGKQHDKQMGANTSSSQENLAEDANPHGVANSPALESLVYHDCPEARHWQQKYKELESRFTALEAQMQEIKAIKDVHEVREYLSKCIKPEATKNAEIKQLQYKLNILTNTVIRFEEKLKESNDKILSMQARSMRRNLIISGIEGSNQETREELSGKIKAFLSNTLNFPDEVPLKAFHRLNYTDGSGYRPTLIKLADLDQKVPILTAAPGLKGKKNNKQCYYYLSEQLPDQLQEERRYAQFWTQDNKKKPKELQKDLKIHRNTLRVDNRPYARKVVPPTAAKVLKLDMDEICQLKQIDLVYGDSKDVEQSEFISYAAKVTKTEDVRKVYRKLRIKYSDATHIMSAHRFHPPNGPANQESSDDGEYGGGRVLLKTLVENKVVNAAVFVVRYYGGKHIGADHFELIGKLAKKALKNAQLINSPRRPFTRSCSMASRSSQAQSHSQAVFSGRGIVTPVQSEVETDALLTADEEQASRYTSEVSEHGYTSGEDSAPQVVTDFARNQQKDGNAIAELNNKADNEESDKESLQ